MPIHRQAFLLGSVAPDMPLWILSVGGIVYYHVAIASGYHTGLEEAPQWCPGSWKGREESRSGLEEGLDVFFDVFGFGEGGVAFDDIAVAIDQEFGEVPFNRFAA